MLISPEVDYVFFLLIFVLFGIFVLLGLCAGGFVTVTLSPFGCAPNFEKTSVPWIKSHCKV